MQTCALLVDIENAAKCLFIRHRWGVKNASVLVCPPQIFCQFWVLLVSHFQRRYGVSRWPENLICIVYLIFIRIYLQHWIDRVENAPLRIWESFTYVIRTLNGILIGKLKQIKTKTHRKIKRNLGLSSFIFHRKLRFCSIFLKFKFSEKN